jgi:dihydropteroate synthase
MGIVNVTPDSFSDGGRFADPDAAAPAGMTLLAEGADIVDVGGESTRPGAAPVEPAEEARRILPAVRALAAAGAVVSVDTRHAEPAQTALAAGAVVMNDVSGFRDPAMVDLAARTFAGCIVMHMHGNPGTMQQAPRYDDVVAEGLAG